MIRKDGLNVFKKRSKIKKTIKHIDLVEFLWKNYKLTSELFHHILNFLPKCKHCQTKIHTMDFEIDEYQHSGDEEEEIENRNQILFDASCSKCCQKHIPQLNYELCRICPYDDCLERIEFLLKSINLYQK